MNKIKSFRFKVPSWNMPSDPVKAVWWFLYWLLQLFVQFFWIPIILMMIYETYSNGVVGGVFNGIVSGVFTLFVGLIVWAALYGALIVIKVSTGISQAVSEMKRMQQQQADFLRQAYSPLMGNNRAEREGRVVEGTITDLDEERQKRRREQ
ncbi:hypothetical protein [Dictyobacter formicarum]|uniref:DUF4282 domain-containing protein n=1 Tax=Dictyobacter formicarum TaxID=2778368 RepID=A0ABQ3VFN2_9CHLR|nr:hypothetical protein [Dictyobacter formicarum]GHO84519.1 hypothetical protein KSZ_25250 [Dictyobacter formicarum]